MEIRFATLDQATTISNMVFAFGIGSILHVGKEVTKPNKKKSCITYIYESEIAKDRGKHIVIHKLM